MKVTVAGGVCRIDRYEEHAVSVVLPDTIDGAPVAVVGAKAFLSCREIERLRLPETVERIEDWAFAHMKNLRELLLPAKDISFGKKVFLGCESLKRVTLYGAQETYEGIPFFLSSMVTLMEEPDPELRLAGSQEGQRLWLKRYDDALTRYLAREDTYGFEPAFIGWFNVEDVDDQREGFVRARRRCKTELAFRRLLYGEGLEQETKERLSAYLLGAPQPVAEHFADAAGTDGRVVEELKLWREIGGFEVLSPQLLMEKLPEADPEVRAFLMECRWREKDAEDFFAGLEL